MRTRRSVDFLIAVAAAVFFTSSFDIFLEVNVGGTVRIAQVFIFILLCAALLRCRLGLTMAIPLGVGGLLLSGWLLLQLAFVPISVLWSKSLAYCAWLALNISLSFSLVNLLSHDKDRLRALLKWYLASYVFVACFGIVQFLLPLFGGPALLVQQWWLPGKVARASGFSYEPSYFATYLIMGLVCIGSLRRSGMSEFRSRPWLYGYLLIVLAIIVSSSRMGIIFLICEISIAPVSKIWKAILDPLRMMNLRVTTMRALALTIILCVSWPIINGIVHWSQQNEKIIELLANGTGLFGTAAHSVQERGNSFQETLHVITEHPLIGRSLGGVAEAIAGLSGQTPRSIEEGKDYEGQCVFAEVIAASGIPGSILFFAFVISTVVSPLRLARRSSPFWSAWLRALVLALVFEWAILQLNQNVLRVYLWVHIAILAAVWFAAESENAYDDKVREHSDSTVSRGIGSMHGGTSSV